jgi:hypothetical protein
MSIFIEILLVYLLYRFIAGFLVPLFRTTSSMRQQFRNMSNQQPFGTEPPPGSESQTRNASSGSNTGSQTAKSNPGKVGEYIDFEEVKGK